MKKKTECERFFEKVLIASSGCWEWQATLTPSPDGGYGLFYAYDHFRIRVPHDLLPFFPSPEIKRSLHTRSARIATKQLAMMSAKAVKMFAYLNSGMLPPDQIHQYIEGQFPSRKSDVSSLVVRFVHRLVGVPTRAMNRYLRSCCNPALRLEAPDQIADLLLVKFFGSELYAAGGGF